MLSEAPAGPAAVPAGDGSWLDRLGFWLFRNRGWVPVPVYFLLVACCFRESHGASWVWPAGIMLVILGHWARLWAIRHIGRSARTRKAKSARLVTTGPYAYVRNPLYVANVCVGTGFVVASRLVWFVPVFWLFALCYYSLIIRWEERLLLERWGRAYRDYAATTPRWAPMGAVAQAVTAPAYSYVEALFRERKTFVATLVMVCALAIKDVLH